MKKIITLALATLTLMSVPACAQRTTTSDDNYRKAVVYYENNDPDKALKLVNKLLDDAPDHLDSRLLRAKIFWKEGKYDNAIRDVTYAIVNYKENPSVYKSTLYYLRGAIYDDMKNYSDAAKDCLMATSAALKDDPEKAQIYIFDYAQELYASDDLHGAEKVYLMILEADESNCSAMVGLARNYMAQKKYNSAIKYIKMAESYDASYSEIYRFKMQILDKMGNGCRAVDAAIEYWKLGGDIDLAAQYIKKQYSYSVEKLGSLIAQVSDESKFQYQMLLSRLYEDYCEYRKTIALNEEIEKAIGPQPWTGVRKAKCFEALGEFDTAIKEISTLIGSIERGTFGEQFDKRDYYSIRGDIYRAAGNYKDAIADYVIELLNNLKRADLYDAIGQCQELLGETDEAIKSYDTGILMDSTYAYLYQHKGDLLRKRGQIAEARNNYEKVLELDTLAEEGSCRMYALSGLGKNDEALEWMHQMIENNPRHPEVQYDAACLYGRMGRINEGIAALTAAFRKGFRKFEHLKWDDDMGPYRNLPEYRSIVKKYAESCVSTKSCGRFI